MNFRKKITKIVDHSQEKTAKFDNRQKENIFKKHQSVVGKKMLNLSVNHREKNRKILQSVAGKKNHETLNHSTARKKLLNSSVGQGKIVKFQLSVEKIIKFEDWTRETIAKFY